MAIQAPPNLTPDHFGALIRAGINDWGGVSPVTPDHVNPEAPWPHLERLARETAREGKALTERLTVYPAYVRRLDAWVAEPLRPAVRQASDAEGFARESAWSPGDADASFSIGAARCRWSREPRFPGGCRVRRRRVLPPGRGSGDADGLGARRSRRGGADVVRAAARGDGLDEAEIATLFSVRGDDLVAVVRAADALRREVNGDEVTYVVNRNINYTNVCYFKCQLLRVLEGQAQREPAGGALRPRLSTRSPAAASRRGSAARPRCACRAASTPSTPAPPTWTSAGRSRRPCPRCTCTRSRRWRSGRARPRSACRSRRSCGNCSRSGWARCRARRPRCSTTRCGATCAPTS